MVNMAKKDFDFLQTFLVHSKANLQWLIQKEVNILFTIRKGRGF